MSLTKSNIKKYLENKDTSYKIFDIKYTEKEKQTINNFKINNEIVFSYYGKFDEKTLLKGYYYKKGTKSISNILNFISNIGNNKDKDIQIIKDIIYKLLDKVTKGYNKDYIWLDIRITLPNKDFNIPRWHFDGFENQSKFVTLLQGLGTLFISDKDIKAKEIFFKIVDKEYKVLANKLKDADIVQPNNNQGTIFLTGFPKNNKLLAIHSEPNNDKSRFFISVMCGTKEEINKIRLNFLKPKSI
jgi:hypothetical protein